MPAKKARPPTLSLETSKKPVTATVIEFQTPIDLYPDKQLSVGTHESPLSSPSSSTSNSPIGYPLNPDTDSDLNADEISRDLAVLEQLRRNVHKNLRLRPIRSAAPSARSQQLPSSSSHSSDSPTTSSSDLPDHRSPSPDPSIASPISAYFTPLTEFRVTPISSRLPDFARDSRRSSRDLSSSAYSTQQPTSQPPLSPSSRGISPAFLLSRLSSPTRPLLIDTRPVGSYLASRLQHSVNMAIPSLILKRSRKPAGAFQSLDSLRQFVTTDQGKHSWDDLMTNGDWDGDVIVFDENMNEKDRFNPQSPPWSIMDVISPLLRYGTVDYLEGGLAAARRHLYLSQLILSRSDSDDSYDSLQNDPVVLSAPGNSSKKPPSGIGLFQIDTVTASRSKTYPEVERSAAPSSRPSIPLNMQLQSWSVIEDYATPSPPPSSTVFSCRQPMRRPSIPALRKLDTTPADRQNVALPKLQVRAVPTKSVTLSLPKHNNSSIRSRSRSPSHLNLVVSNHNHPPHSPPGSARLLSPGPAATGGRPNELMPPPSPSFAPGTPRTPGTPIPPSPSTARPDTDQPPTTEDAFPVFTVSTILPAFLFLGPEPSTEEHVEELLTLGVKRILNIAIECDDDHGLKLRERFERYVRIPMRDTVEEDNITRGVREVCNILDDARLHSAATYVHCKAGKSRSVTAVMAYLIHANHWTLSRAYAFVVGRRKGISPNIGFVSELMTFEEQELGGKSVGVVKMPPPKDADGDDPSGGNGGNNNNNPNNNNNNGMQGSYQVAVGGNRRAQHVRESLPPAFTIQHSLSLVPMSGDVAQLGDSQQELEIKDAEGRYRHARRAPVDEATLQPMRRVSKAGLESSMYGEVRG